MRIELPDGDVLVPDAEFLKTAGDVTARTGNNWDQQGCPYVMIGGRKFRPLKAGLNWLASRIKYRNRPRSGAIRAARKRASDLHDTS
jgi:hypothetical protein